MQVSVIGAGYVGLVSGVCLAHKGHDVVCVDMDQQKVDQINRGQSPIYEEGLDDLLQQTLPDKFRATTDLIKAVQGSDITLIAVGTPFANDTNTIDLTQIKDCAQQIGEALKNKKSYHVIVVKSTVVPGTTDSIVLEKLQQGSGKNAGLDFGLGMNPEFLREGCAVADFLNPDRIVMGGLDEKSIDVQQKLYDIFPEVDKVRTNNKTAEMIKYSSNTLLATMISFSNEIANLSAVIGDVDVKDVMDGVKLDKRFSPILENGERIYPGMLTYLEAGCGFGGSCFPKDLQAIVAYADNVGQQMPVLRSVIATNALQPMELIKLLQQKFPNIKGVKIAVLGLAFKAGTNDMRESPSIPVVNAIVGLGAEVKVFDPVAQQEAQQIFGSEITYCQSLEATVKDVDVVMVLTHWPQFDKLDKILSSQASQPLVIDGRRQLEPSKFKDYLGIGGGTN
ncbi:MAG: UDP-glucose/GDP-mannose dehydrogenase family protein [Magnetococcales bacterium]|nr:UDP-glucose/GDP-mannose dehydrogenase family protein [Magnetococcales bacterium]